MLSKFTLDELAALLDDPRAAVVVPTSIATLRQGDVFFWEGRWCRYESDGTYRMKTNRRVTVSYFQKDAYHCENGIESCRDAIITRVFWIPKYEFVLMRQHPGVMSEADRQNETGEVTHKEWF